MRPNKKASGPAPPLALGHADATATTDATTRPLPMLAISPLAPESAADPRAAYDATTPLRPAQRGLAWLCELLRSQQEE